MKAKNINRTILIFALLFSFLASAYDPLVGAEYRIKKYRTRKVVVYLVDNKGKPVSFVHFQLNMQRHQFLFGCNLFMFNRFPSQKENQKYLELWKNLFNYATIPIYLCRFSPKQKQRNIRWLDELVDWCEENHITIKAHPLIWHTKAGSPDWLPSQPDQVEEVLKEQIEFLLKRYKGRIQFWDLLNEPTTTWLNRTQVANWENKIGPVAVVEKGLSWAKSQDPNSKFLVNDYLLRSVDGLAKAISSFKKIKYLLQDPIKHYPVSYYRFVKALKKQGIEIDGVGLQSHMHRRLWDWVELAKICERYSRLSLPLQFSEITILSGELRQHIDYSNWQNNLPWQSTAWGEQRQADYVEKFYTYLFSQPKVMAITWWDFSDRGAWLNAPAGLVRADLTPKPAYFRLYQLIRKRWWTQLEGNTDKEGKFEFRGFCGEYQLDAKGFAPAGFKIDCQKKNGQTIHIQLFPKK